MPRTKVDVRRAHSGRAGFSIVELMVVVAIVGVLAAVGISLLRQYVVSSKSGEAVTVVQAIRAAQERFRAENQVYLDVSQGDLTRYYPTDGEPGNERYNWEQPDHDEYPGWQRLAVPVTIPVRFGYATVAGGVGDGLPLLATARDAPWNAGTQVVEPWYVIQARGDPDEDGTFTFLVATSFTGELYQEDGDVEAAE
jgi:prepilin-type N-terminal cleavage/methylation domain-containing protein